MAEETKPQVSAEASTAKEETVAEKEEATLKESAKIKAAVKELAEKIGGEVKFIDGTLFIGTEATPLTEDTLKYLQGSDEGTHGEAKCISFATEAEALEYIENYGK